MARNGRRRSSGDQPIQGGTEKPSLYQDVTDRIVRELEECRDRPDLFRVQGSRLIGSYDSAIAFGQPRALIVRWRIILPDGSSIEIDNLPATDAAGYAGLEDEVDFHTWGTIKGVALATLLGVGTELSIGDGQSDLVRAVQQSAKQSTNAAGQRLVGKNLNIQPTITIRPGWPLRVIVEKDLVLRPYHG
jgi:type IV secretory pathway VirB10-like protein